MTSLSKNQYETQSTMADDILYSVYDPEASDRNRRETKGIMSRRSAEMSDAMNESVQLSEQAYASRSAPTRDTSTKTDYFDVSTGWMSNIRGVNNENSPEYKDNVDPLPFKGDFSIVAAATKKIESGDDYKAVGPIVKKGMYKGQRAVGAYQVMPANIPAWTKQAIGREVTVSEFINSPEIQDAVFENQIKANIEKYGNVEDAISTWFSGRPLKEAKNDNDGYTSVPKYLHNYRKAYMQLYNTNSDLS